MKNLSVGVMVRRAAAFLLAIVLVVVSYDVPVAEAAMETFTVTGTYKQSDARAFVEKINEFRQSEDAWYWDWDDETKVYPENLQPVTWDYNLEQLAMQRAMEIAICFSHTRLDGSSWGSASYNGTQTWAENLAAGYRDADRAYMAWREDDERSGGQTHRRIMLGAGYGAIGVAHFNYEGSDYWVLEFGLTNSGAPDPGVVDGKVTKSFQIDSSRLEPRLEPAVGFGGGDFPYATERLLPKLWVRVGIKGEDFGNDWGRGFPVDPSEYTLTWTPEYPDRIEVRDGKFYSVGLGTCELIASTEYHGEKLEYRSYYHVTRRQVWNIEVEDIPDQKYTGQEVCPHAIVKVAGYVLTEGKDYIATYENNINPGRSARIVFTLSESFYTSPNPGQKYAKYFAIVAEPTASPTPIEEPVPPLTEEPILSPTKAPTTVTPKATGTPIPQKTPSPEPSRPVSKAPSPTAMPSVTPAKTPTQAPTKAPTQVPGKTPTQAPTGVPGKTQTPAPTRVPSQAPTKGPTKAPTQAPGKTPTQAPGKNPTVTPAVPTQGPSQQPTPTEEPVQGSVLEPTEEPDLTDALESTGEPNLTETLEPTGELELSVTPEPDLSPEAEISPEAEMSPEIDGSQEPTIAPEITDYSKPAGASETSGESDATVVPEDGGSVTPSADAISPVADMPEKGPFVEAGSGFFGRPENMWLAFSGGCLIGCLAVLTIALILRKHARNKQWKEE